MPLYDYDENFKNQHPRKNGEDDFTYVRRLQSIKYNHAYSTQPSSCDFTSSLIATELTISAFDTPSSTPDSSSSSDFSGGGGDFGGGGADSSF